MNTSKYAELFVTIVISATLVLLFLTVGLVTVTP